MGLAVSLELPLLVIDIQRGGPSTGLPTKTEASDLLMAMYGRHGESPLPDRRHPQPGRLLRHGHRGGPHRRQVPHARRPPVRRLHRQRRRALEAARRRVAARHLRRVRHRDEPHEPRRQRGVLALPARPRHPRPTVGRARDAGAHAPHRRHREGGRVGQHQLRPGEPRADGPAPGGQDRRHRQRHPAGRRHRRRRRRRGAAARLGVDLGRDRRRHEPGPGQGPAGRPRPPDPPQPVPAQPRRRPPSLPRRCSCPR